MSTFTKRADFESWGQHLGAPMTNILGRTRLTNKFLVISLCITISLLLIMPLQKAWEFSDGLPASAVLGQTGFTSKFSGTTVFSLDTPLSTMFDPQGNLWVADTQNNRVMEFKAPFTSYESASIILGENNSNNDNWHHDDGQPTNSSLNNPSGVAFDTQGNLWVADTQNNRVMEFKAPFTSYGQASVILGQSSSNNDNWHYDEGQTTSSSMNNPTGVAFDPLGQMSIADSRNNRVLLYLVSYPPNSLEATPGNATIDLSWSSPSDDGGSQITGYDIYRGTSPGGENGTPLATNIQSTSFNDSSSLVLGQRYYYQATAINSVGESIKSTEASAVAGAVPSKVTGLVAGGASTSEIDLTWTAPGSNGYSISGYRVEESNDGTIWETLASNTGSSSTSYHDTVNLLPNTKYYYRVSAINAIGVGPVSDAISATTIPLPPSSLDASTTSTSEIDLTWTAPSGTITGYKVERSTDGINWNAIMPDTGTSARTYSDTGLAAGTVYYYRLSAINSGLASTPSNIASAETNPPAPTSLSASAASTSEIDLTWTAPSGTITGYKIERSTDGINWSTVVSDTSTATTTYSDTGLESNTLYTYRVSALGQGGASGTSSGTASATTIPSAPTVVNATAEAGMKVTVEWQAPPGTGIITGYKIERSTDGTNWGTPTSLGTSTTYEDSGLDAGTTYYYKVAAINAGDASDFSVGSNGVTAGDIPSAVAQPEVTVLSGGVMSLEWTAPDTNGYPITSYSLDESVSGGIFNTVATIAGAPPETNYTVTGLTSGTQYQWRLEATNALGTSTAGSQSSPETALSPLRIEAQTVSGSLIPGAGYTISPDPYGVPSALVDGASGDADNKTDGITTVNLVPFGTYNITMSAIPAGYNVLGNWTLYTQGSTSLSGVIAFRLVPMGANTSSLGTTVITTPPALNDTSLSTWSGRFHAIKINTTESAIDAVSQLPPIISAGSDNSDGISGAVSNQATIQLNTTFAPTISPQNIIDDLQVPTYSMPNDKNIVSVIPSIVTANNATNGQIVTTPPLSEVVPGQPMIIPVQDSAIPSDGGIKQLFVQSSPTSQSVGNPTSDWFVIRTNQTLPSTLPNLPTLVNNSETLFVNVTYPYEVTGQGFNWGNPSNFAVAPNMTITLPKPLAGSNIQTYADGCAIPAVFVFDSTKHNWTSNRVTMLSESADAADSSNCDYIVQVPHFSQFAFGGLLQTSTGHSSDVQIFWAPPLLTTSSIGPQAQAESNGGFGGILPLEDNVTKTIAVGEPVSVNVDVNDPSGASFVQHVAFHTNFGDPTDQNGQTYLMYEPGQPMSMFDPSHLLSSANVTASQVGNNLVVTFNMTFAKPMKTSDVVIRGWDQNKVSFEGVYHKALSVAESLPAGSPGGMDTQQAGPMAAGNAATQSLIATGGAAPPRQGANPMPVIAFSGNGTFTFDGHAYEPFNFDIKCRSDGECTDSSMDIGNSTLPVGLASYYDNGGSHEVSLYSKNLACNVTYLNQTDSSSRLVFNCLHPFGSGMSYAVGQDLPP